MNLEAYNSVVGSTAEEFAGTGLDINQFFMWAIKKQNEMYDLPINVEPTLLGLGESPLVRMQGFMKTLQKEMNEGLEIMALLTIRDNLVNHDRAPDHTSVAETLRSFGIEDGKRVQVIADAVVTAYLAGGEELNRYILVSIADWLADMTVYNRSEALKFGIPLESILAIVMGSNFTKLQADGSVLRDANGKVEKGPNFVPPEPAIYATLFESHLLIGEANDLIEAASNVQTLSLPILHDPMADILFAQEVDTDEYMLDSDDDIDSLVP
jgi:hypothetical protein